MGVANCGQMGPSTLLIRTARATLCVDASCICGCAKRCAVGPKLGAALPVACDVASCG